MKNVIMEVWAIEMLKVVNNIDASIKGGLDGLGSTDGVVLDQSTSKKIIEGFKVSGYAPYEQTDNRWVIESPEDPTRGICIEIDYADSDEDLAYFYDDNL